MPRARSAQFDSGREGLFFGVVVMSSSDHQASALRVGVEEGLDSPTCFEAGDASQVVSELKLGDQLLALRSREGLTQSQLGRLIGTSASVICRLEDPRYRGHSLSTLYRIALALNYRVQINFVPLKRD